MTPGPVSDTYQGPDDWGDLRALLASVSAETEPNKTRLRLAREQFRALVGLAESGEKVEDEAEGLLERALPMLVRLGDFIGNGPIDAERPNSLGERCDLIGDIKVFLASLVGYCRTCGGSGLVPFGLPSDGPVPCPECGPEDAPL